MIIEWATETENIIKQVISILDPQDLSHRTYNIKNVLDMPEDKAKRIYDSIPQTIGGLYGSSTQKRGTCEVVSALGHHYTFTATYSIKSDRTEADEDLSIERFTPARNFCANIYSVYYKKYKMPPINDDFETLAKQIILRLNEDDSKNRWTLGYSLKAYAKACFNIIPKEKYDSKHHTIASKGIRLFVGSDGLEYLFIAESSDDCGGSEWYVSGSLKVECTAIGLYKHLYSYSYYSR